jgi:hypothetical protein
MALFSGFPALRRNAIAAGGTIGPNVMKSVRSVIAAALSLISVTAAVAGEYTDPSGFSFTYPEGWFAVAKWQKFAKIPPELTNWAANNHMDLNRAAVVVIHAVYVDLPDNLNVIVEPQEIPLDEASVKEFVDGIAQQFRSMGLPTAGLTGGVQPVGDNKAVVLDYLGPPPGQRFFAHQRQYYLPLAGKTYILTCTAKPERFAQCAAVFEEIVKSFSATGTQTADAAQEHKPNLHPNQTLTLGVSVGAAIGMLVALLAAWKSMGRREAELVASSEGRYRRR